MLTESTYGFSRPRTVLMTGPTYLDSAIASVVCDLDATISASYNGSGVTWANLIASPADGTTRSAYDFQLGDAATSTTYPTFNGTPGNISAYWTTDGGDYFRLKTLAGTLPVRWHRTSGGAPFWAAMTFKTPPGIFTGSRAFWGNATGTLNRGIVTYATSADTLSMISSNASTAPVTNNLFGTFTGTTDYVYIFSADASLGAGNVRIWVNSTTGNSFTHSFSASVINSTDNFHLLASRGPFQDGVQFMEADLRLYSFAMGNEFLNDAGAAAIIAHLNARHGRAYA